MDTCAGCKRQIDPAFDVFVRDNFGQPWHTLCMTRARGATGHEDRVGGAGPLWAWAIVTLFLPIVGLVAGLVYLFRNRIGPGLALIIEAVVLVAIYVVLLTSSSSAEAWEMPGQRAEASPFVLGLVHQAQGFWAERDVVNPVCAGGDPRTWNAPRLRAQGVQGDIWGLGNAATCEIALSSDLTDTLIRPGQLENSYDGMMDACDAITHEVGHADGLEHSATGVMVADSWGRPVSSAPMFCVGAVRAHLLTIAHRRGVNRQRIASLRQAIRMHLHEDTFL